MAARLPPGAAQAVPIAEIILLLQALAAALQVCYPTPAIAAARLVEPPRWQILRRAAWQSWVCGAVGDKWQGSGVSLRDVQEAVLSRVRDGLEPYTIEAAFREVGH